MRLKPDFERFRAAVQHQEADRVPFFEMLVDYGIQSRFIGREVSADDLKSQVEFWASAGYDFIPITVGMMEPGSVTKESAISKIIEEIVLEDEEQAEEQHDPAWSLEYHSFIKDRTDFEAAPPTTSVTSGNRHHGRCWLSGSRAKAPPGALGRRHTSYGQVCELALRLEAVGSAHGQRYEDHRSRS